MTDSGYLSTPSMESGPKRRFQDKALREALLSLPLGVYLGANRYDTDDLHRLHLWNDRGESFDIDVPRLNDD